MRGLAELITGTRERSPRLGEDLAETRRATPLVGRGRTPSSTAARANGAGGLASAEPRGRVAPVPGSLPRERRSVVEETPAANAGIPMDVAADRERSRDVRGWEVVTRIATRGRVDVPPGLRGRPAR